MGKEREAKLSAPEGFEVPDLSGVAPRLTESAPRRQRMLAVYYDTDDLALARAGMLLRHRTGEPGDPWMVKLAGSASGSELVRQEVTFAGRPACVPPGAAALVRAHTRGRRLAPVVRLRTVRTIRELRDGDTVVVEIADDRVTSYVGFLQTSRFRELEVELKTPDDARRDVIDAVVELLVDHGAMRTAPLSKVVRALGVPAQAPPDVVVGAVDEHTDAREFVRHVVAGSTAKMLTHDPALRLGAAERDVHAFRVATRRLRSDLRTFRPLLDPEWVSGLRSELSWIADVVGAVRDTDVLELRLRDQVAQLGDGDAAGAESLLAQLAAQGAAARTAMLAALHSARYDALIESLVAAAAQPKFAGAADVDVSAQVVVANLVRRAWKRLPREVRAAGKDPSDEDLHGIRIVAKRTRYAAEAAARLFGKPAERFAAAIADLQTVLGDHHDASVAEEWLRGAVSAPGADAQAGVAAGMLIARQRRERERLHRRWRKVWKKASRAERRDWF